jgi:nucleoid DNA-binding protein
MDIDLLSKMVKELILDNDRVVLPGLGSFVAEIVPSTFTDKGYTINPPYRRLYFRSRPDQGEELARFYAESNKVDLTVADKIVKDFIQELKSVLHVKKTVIFPGLGRLRATKENTVFFVADEDLDIYPDGFGLEPISLKTHQESREEVSAAVVELKSILEEAPEEKAVPEEMTEGVAPDVVDGFILEDVVPEVIAQDVVPEAIVSKDELCVEVIAQDVVPEVVPEEVVPEKVVPEDVVEEVVTEDIAEDIAPEEADEDPVPEVAAEAVDECQALVEAEAVDGGQAADAVVSPKKNVWKSLGKALLWAVVAAITLIVVYVVVARLCPGVLDSLLYTSEELQIVNEL